MHVLDKFIRMCVYDTILIKKKTMNKHNLWIDKHKLKYVLHIFVHVFLLFVFIWSTLN